MKKLIVLPLLALLAIPAFADSDQSTSTKLYDESEMLEQEEGYGDTLDQEAIDQQEMEENITVIESEDSDIVDYSDRTRTNRERKALNTGSDASDDQ
jgi:hypothetical protein